MGPQEESSENVSPQKFKYIASGWIDFYLISLFVLT